MFEKKNLSQSLWKLVLLAFILIAAGSQSAWANGGIKTNFLTAYPSAAGTRLVTLPSAPTHCGACHYNFTSASGGLNPYGQDIQAGGTSSAQILAIGPMDSDGDGFSNDAEIQGIGFANIPTFPGLQPSNVSNVSGVTLSEINGFLVPVASAVSCNNASDCDDTLFCTGIESCSSETSLCVAGPGDPCPAGETCNEDTDTCVIAEGGNLKINKATVKAGKTAGKDSIQLSGSLNASQDDLNAAVGGTVIVSIMAEFIPGSGVIEYTFPIEAENVKKGKYTSPKPAVKADPVTSLAIDTNKGTIKFSAKNDDLSGLSCPITVRVEIGAYNAEQELGEDIVNGPKKPCPPELLL